MTCSIVALNSVASIYRDVAVLQNNAEDAVGLINLENRSAITELSVRLDRTGAVRRLEDIATTRRSSMATAIRFWCLKRCSAR